MPSWKNDMVDCVEGSTEIKQPQQGAAHGKEKIVYLPGHSSFPRKGKS